METIINQSITTSYVSESVRPSVFAQFINWCKSQEPNRYGWLGISLGSHGCILTPITMFAIILSGNFIFFWIAAIVAMGMTLVTNLAAMPTKITIPVFFFSILIDIVIITACIAHGFDITTTYV